MKIGIENMVFRENTDERTSLQLIADAGFDCVDYSFFNKAGKTPDWLLADDYLEKAAATRKMLDEIGLTCYQCHTPFRLLGTAPRDESNPDYLGILRALEYAGIIGAYCAVVHALTPPRGGDVVEFNLEFYRTLIPFARQAKVKIAIENLFKHDEYHPYLLPKITAVELKALLSELPNEYFTGCLDVGHAAICGCEPDEFLRMMPKGMITCLHIQDNDRTRDLHLVPYISKLRWAEFIAALKEYAYQGVFNLENSHFFENMPPELYPVALRFAAETGRYMAGEVEK